MSTSNKTILKWTVPVIAICCLALAWYFVPLREWAIAFSNWAEDMGVAGIALLSIAYVICTLLLVPGVPLTLAVAFVYGWWSLAICFLGGMTAALIAFLAGRYLVRDLITRFIRRHPMLKAVDAVAREESFKTILLARLTPVTPFAMENYAFGITGVRLVPYLAATAVGIIPGTILNVWVGVIGRTAARGGASVLGWSLLGIGLLASIVLVVWITRKARRKVHQQKITEARS
ncbi:putative membrane protein YdjX (TVP38/TMEM64 family) [Rhodoligotrophos appendicifer]|uniref:TVP38/TMEM64 family protein n=1 Tax=Rhodoligotrophos appendicifer TaxID=987056 RepID=UPI0011860689|nr:VTT domain-containing protein [Rhodoligotrophos appendicifer]